MKGNLPRSAAHAGIGDLVDLAEIIGRDGARADRELRQRDRRIGRSHEGLRGRDTAQLLAWLDSADGDRRSLPGAAVERGMRSGVAILLISGLLLGWLAAAAVFYYDGSHPVNIVSVLSLFVGAQVLLVLLLILSLLPGGSLRAVPGLRTFFEILDLLRPGRLLELVARRLPQEHRLRAQSILDSGRRRGTLHGRVAKWAVTFASQVFAAAFNAGALLGALHLVFFTDLAFAWSTTLKVTADGIHRVTELLSAPWAALFPAASPSPALVESTRYFRLKEGLLPPGESQIADPAVFGQWWPFLIVAMLVYGFLPRVMLLAFAAVRLRRSVQHTFLHYPGASNILERMNGPLVDTRATEAEVTPPPAGAAAAGRRDTGSSGGARICFNWGEVPFDDETLASLLPAGSCTGSMLRAGGGNSVEEDGEVVRRASGVGAEGAAIFTRSWEPPMEDFLDFLSDLRKALGPTAPLTVVLAGPPERGGMGTVGTEVAGIWRASLSSLADPWVFVETAGGNAP